MATTRKSGQKSKRKSAMMQAHRSKHDSLTIALHWIIALGLILLAGTELIRHEFPKGSLMREGLKPLHQPLGTILFALIIFRVAYRLFAPRLAHPAGSHLAIRAASAMHLALYALMISIPLLGLISVLGKDKSINFGVFTIAVPLKQHFGDVTGLAREAHEILGISILVLVGIHAAAALVHHYLLRDETLRRMLPGSVAAARRTL